MAVKKRKGKKRRRLGLKIALALLVCLALGVFSLYAASRVVHVRYATVHLRDLPAAFEGTTVLFVSDLDIHSASGARAAAAMMDALAPLQPDLLLLLFFFLFSQILVKEHQLPYAEAPKLLLILAGPLLHGLQLGLAAA